MGKGEGENALGLRSSRPSGVPKELISKGMGLSFLDQPRPLSKFLSPVTLFMKTADNSPAAEEWPSRILVVEDDPVLLEHIGDYFTMLGIPHTLAQDGREAIEKMKNECFPLVFTDMNMPHIDGMQLIHHVTDLYPGTDVVAMTGYSQDYNLVDVIRAGAIDYMTKPFSFDELKAKIKRVTKEKRFIHLLHQKIAKQQHSEIDLSLQKKTLLEQVDQQKKELLETNTALRIILRQRDREKDDLANTLKTRFFEEIAPYLQKLRHTQLHEVQKHYLDIITMNLENIFTPGAQGRSFSHPPFTEMETKIVNLIKQQKGSKEIANILKVSTGTIRTHRENIRKKMQITNTNKSLYKTIISIL